MLDAFLITQKLLAVVLVGYLLGAVPFAHLAGRLRGVYMFQTGSTRAGAANVFWNVVRRIRALRTQAEEAVEQAGRGDALERALKTLNDKLYPLEERLVQFRARANQDLIAQPTAIDSKLARLLNFASMADAPPTQGALDLLQRLSDGIAERASLLDEVEHSEFAEVMRLAGVEL